MSLLISILGHIERLKENVKTTAKINRKPFPAHLFQMESEKTDLEWVQSEKGQATFLDLFRPWQILVRTMATFFNWSVCTLTYYALTSMSMSFSRNIFLNYR